mgnify:CR=1 FL=1
MLEKFTKKGRAAKQAPAEQEEQAAAPTVDEYAEAAKAGAPRVALVGRYSERTPVQIKNAAHLAQLRAEHGDGAVEVQS